MDPAKKARAYSEGNRQKVALIAALASDAELLIFDEPTAGLNPLMEATFRDCVQDERRRGRTVLLSSHILAEAEALSDRVTIIRDGHAAETGTLAELRHLTRITVDAELAGPVSLDGLAGVHAAASGPAVALRGGSRRAERRAGPADRGRRPGSHLPSADAGRAVPSLLFGRTGGGGSSGMTVQAPPAAPHARLARTGRAGAGLAGTGTLTKLAFRRDRIMLPAWVYLITVLVATTAYSLKKLYPTAAARAQLEVTAGGNPALRFLYGRLNGSSLGALTTWRYGIWAAIFGALMTIFIVIRHTRADEEAGRLELVGSAAVGRQAALTAGLLTAVTANLAISVLLAIALPFSGLAVSGSVALALAIGASGLAFTGIAAVAAQLASRARGARGMAFGVLGAAYALRAIGDWPAGRPVLAVLGVAAGLGRAHPAVRRPAVVGADAAAHRAGRGRRRGLRPRRAARPRRGGAARPARPGRLPLAARAFRPGLAAAARRARWVGGRGRLRLRRVRRSRPGDRLAGRRQRPAQAGGHQARRAGRHHQRLPGRAHAAGRPGRGGYATSAVLRLRAEETAGLAEPLLATAVGRVRWGLSHLAIAVFGSAVLLAVAGLAAGLGYGVRIGAAAPQAARMLGAALAQLPASLVVAGVAVVLVGLLPRVSVAGAWTVLGAVVVIDLFGEALQLSHWILDISPFTHAPRLPGGPVSAAPLLWLCLAAVAFSAVGLAAVRRRDLG